MIVTVFGSFLKSLKAKTFRRPRHQTSVTERFHAEDLERDLMSHMYRGFPEKFHGLKDGRNEEGSPWSRPPAVLEKL